MNFEKRGFIGVFDSGVGGLSVLRAIRARMPGHDLVYIADSAWVPYGEKPPATIVERSRTLAGWLARRGAAAIVIACNTATAAAAQILRSELAIPVIGMEPAVKPAVAATRSRVIGVLATNGTLQSARFAGLLDRFGHGYKVLTIPCPELVAAVERAELNSAETRRLVGECVGSLAKRGADVIVLGCTHFPFLRHLIAEAAGPGIRIIDTGEAVARQTERFAPAEPIQRGTGRVLLLTTKQAPGARETLRQLWLDPEAEIASLPL